MAAEIWKKRLLESEGFKALDALQAQGKKATA